MAAKRDAWVGGLVGLVAVAVFYAVALFLLSNGIAKDNVVLPVVGIALVPGIVIGNALGIIFGVWTPPTWLMALVWAGANAAIYSGTLVAWRQLPPMRVPVIALWAIWLGVAILLGLASSWSD